MSNEAAYREIMAQRLKDQERRDIDYERQIADMWIQHHSCHAEVRADCSCTCGKCGCCR